VSNLIFDICSECGKKIMYGESYYCISKNRELAHRKNGEAEADVKSSEVLAFFCRDCAAQKDFKDILVANKQKTFTDQLDRIIFAKSSPLAVINAQYYSGDELSMGTGIFISQDGYLLTAKHIIQDVIDEYADAHSFIDVQVGAGIIKRRDRERELKRIFNKITKETGIEVNPLSFGVAKGGAYTALIGEEMIDEESDMVIVQVLGNKKKFKTLKINTEYIPALNEEVFGITTTGYDATIFINRVIAIEKQNTDRGIVIACQTDFAPIPGNSGGAILNKYGEIIGIITASKQGSIRAAEQDTGLSIDQERGLFYSLSTCSINFKKFI